MQSPERPANEAQRLASLYELEILENSQIKILDELVELAATICDTPMSAISLIDQDRQFFKAKQGLSVQETPRDISFCGHAILQANLMIVEDASKDQRFFDNPLVTGAPYIRFYAGFPLQSPLQEAMGALCVIDSKPRTLTDAQYRALEILGHLAAQQLELLRSLKREEEARLQNLCDADEREILIANMRILLDNTRVGIFTVDRSLCIKAGYAPYLESILEMSPLTGRSIYDILLKRADISSDQLSRMQTALTYIIGSESLFFEANEPWLLREMSITLPSGEKHLHLEWAPILAKDSDRIESMLVSIHDVTKIKVLEKEAAAHRRDQRHLEELIEIGPDRFGAFQLRLRTTLESIDIILREGEAKKGLDLSFRDRIYRALHTVKGLSHMLGLSDLSNQIHLAEDMLKHRTKLALRDIRALQYGIDEIRLTLDMYVKASNPLIRLKNMIETKRDSDLLSLHKIIEDLAPLADRLALSLGKSGLEIRWDCEDEVILSYDLADALSRSFIHILRNTIDHGLETPDERTRLGKPAQGVLRIFRDSQGRIGIQDDGRGLNMEKLKAKSPGKDFGSNRDLGELIFVSGLSTKDSADEHSGRGIGMDAVRASLEEAGASIDVVPTGEDAGFLHFYLAVSLPKSA